MISFGIILTKAHQSPKKGAAIVAGIWSVRSSPGADMFIDSHIHLDMEEFDSDRDEVIQRALSADVRQVITVGIDVSSSLKAISLTERYDSVFAAVGIHPHNADDADKKDLMQIESICVEKKVVAIGEIGLDFYRNLSSRRNQKKYFKQQLDIAMRCNLPVVVHSREAHDDVLKMLSLFESGGLKGVIHCFSGGIDLAAAVIKMGYFISLAGTITFAKASPVHEVVAGISLDRLLIETDSPFLSPIPYRGRRNEPSRVVHTAQKVADIRGISLEELAARTSNNARRLFKLPLPNHDNSSHRQG
jgi:TatD DNase family protein